MRATRRLPAFKRLLAATKHHTMPERTREAVEAILLIETTERPSAVRFVEWTAYEIARALHLPRRTAPRTLGPFQLTDAPWDFGAATSQAAQMLAGASSDEQVSLLWNGSARRQAGSCVSYSEALAIARSILAEPCATTRESEESRGLP